MRSINAKYIDILTGRMRNNVNTVLNIISVLVLFVLVPISTPQYQNVRVSSPNAYWPQEPSIVINPKNTNELLVGSNTDHYFYSRDGGLTWTWGQITSSHGIVGDPCVVVDTLGNYYYFHLVPTLSKVVCQRTSALGGAWSDGAFTGLNGNKDNDKEWAVVDPKTNNLYVAWAQFDQHGSSNPQDSSEILLSRSTDMGETWSNPVSISNRKGAASAGIQSCHCPMPGIGLNNDVYVTWMSPKGLMLDISHDGGLTWLENDIKVTPSTVYWLSFQVAGVRVSPGFPIINCDRSNGPNRGHLYICWTDVRNGYSNSDVWLAKSVDGGLTWSSPKRVNDDQTTRQQFFGTMTIDQANGNLYFLFYDRRNYSDSRTDVYMGVSKDGGETITNIKISESPFTPVQADFIGDYNGIAAHNNVVRPVWTRVDNGVNSLWTAIINNISGLENEEEILPDEFDLTSVYPNPFNPSTTINYTLNKEGRVVLKIFNVLGQELMTISDIEQTAGKYQFEWKAEGIPSGTYIIQMNFDGKSKTQKVILSK